MKSFVQRKLLEKVENDIDKLEDEATALMDRTKDDTRSMIDDANNRFNDKVSGLEVLLKENCLHLKMT